MRSSINLFYITKNRQNFKIFFDKFIYIIGIGGPSMTIPQIIKIYNEKNAGGISIIAWSGYTMFAILWVVYGILHHQKPIIATNTTIIILNSLVLIGVLLYG